MGLFDFLNQDKNSEDDSYLEDWQKEEVKKGNYDTFNFDEDDTSDEDDYYHEDDE